MFADRNMKRVCARFGHIPATLDLPGGAILTERDGLSRSVIGCASRELESETVRIPIVEEQVVVGKREVETGRVHVRTRVED